MIEVYGIKINEMNKATFNRLINLVSSEKRERIEKYRFVEDAKRCLLGDLLARYAICKRLNIKNGQIVFGYNNYGKPVLIKPAANVYFNISHSGDWVVCAVDDAPVGIDVELIKPTDFKIAQRFFTAEEYKELMNRNETEKLVYFYKLWTLKESYIKAVGKGLTIPLNSFSFCLDNGEVSMVSDKDSFSKFNQRLIDDKYIVSVCRLNRGYCRQLSAMFRSLNPKLFNLRISR